MKIIRWLQIGLLLTIFGCNLRAPKDSSGHPYETLEASKKNGAFVTELIPEKKVIEIEGHKYFKIDAWIEHAHNSGNFSDEIWKDGLCFSMELKYDPKFNIDLSHYIHEIGNGPSPVWFFLTTKEQ